MRKIPPTLQEYGQAPEGYIRRLHSVIDWMLDRQSPGGIRRGWVRIQVRRMGASARHVTWSARLQESNHALLNEQPGGESPGTATVLKGCEEESRAREFHEATKGGYKCLTRARAPPLPSLGIMRVPSKRG